MAEVGDAAGSADVTAAVGTQGSLLERMTSAGISEPRASGHIERGLVRVGGEVVTDPAAAVPWPTAWVVGPE